MKTGHLRRVAVLCPAAAALLGGTGLVALTACNAPQAPFAPSARNQKLGAAMGPDYTMSSGSKSTLIGRATFDAFHVKRKTGDWQLQIDAKDPLDVAVQTITFAPGSQSGWHRHPGPVLIQVVTGTMTFYQSDDPTCTPIVRTAGQGFLDVGEDAHIARNETSMPATNVVTYFAPPGAALRIDAPAPGNCPF
ncbi:MAG TPA: hypothetical protein VJU87_08080 [Gemmatimonadaceae bacterium]|nr:hypothetical protein [Gemmatimonadaceae bacterium]